MPKLTKAEYEQKMNKEIDMLYLYFPRSPEREHIITTLNWALRELYPEDPTAGPAKTKFCYLNNSRLYTHLDGRPICGYVRNGLICNRSPHQEGPCAMGYFYEYGYSNGK